MFRSKNIEHLFYDLYLKKCLQIDIKKNSIFIELDPSEKFILFYSFFSFDDLEKAKQFLEKLEEKTTSFICIDSFAKKLIVGLKTRVEDFNPKEFKDGIYRFTKEFSLIQKLYKKAKVPRGTSTSY